MFNQSPIYKLFLVIFPKRKYAVSIKYWNNICFKSNLSINIHFIYIQYFNYGNTLIVAWIHLIKIYIYLVFQLIGPLNSATIWIPTQIWSDSVLEYCMSVLEKYTVPIGHMQPSSLTQHNVGTKSQ